jgi:protein TonB
MVEEKEIVDAPSEHKDGFVKTDYLDTDRLRHLTYGNLVLRRQYHVFMAKGIGYSLAIFISIFLVYLSYGWIKQLLTASDDEIVTVKPRQLSISDLQPPPPMDQSQPPPPPPPSFKPPAAPDVGEIKKVRDEEAPRQKTFADQDLIKKATAKGAYGEGDTTGLSDPNIGFAGGAGGGPIEPADDGGDPPDFVAVEKDPEFVNRVQAVYPEMARKAGIEGKVIVKVLIGKNGKPEKAQIIKNPGTDIFDEAVINAVMNSTYTPAIQNGRPVKVWMMVPFSFKLNQR